MSAAETFVWRDLPRDDTPGNGIEANRRRGIIHWNPPGTARNEPACGQDGWAGLFAGRRLPLDTVAEVVDCDKCLVMIREAMEQEQSAS